jgi:VanZ family protein
VKKRNNLKSESAVINFTKYWLPVLIYAILIFYLSSIPGEEIPVVFKYQDVFLHIIEYAVFALLFSRAIKAYHPRLSFNRRFVVVLAFSFLYALSDEFHQFFVPQRYCSLLDLMYDGIGIAVADVLSRFKLLMQHFTKFFMRCIKPKRLSRSII